MYVHLTFLGSNRSDAEEALFGGLTWEKSTTDNWKYWPAISQAHFWPLVSFSSTTNDTWKQDCVVRSSWWHVLYKWRQSTCTHLHSEKWLHEPIQLNLQQQKTAEGSYAKLLDNQSDRKRRLLCIVSMNQVKQLDIQSDRKRRLLCSGWAASGK